MRRALLLAGCALLAMPWSASAQVERWNDRAQAQWGDDAPRVRVAIEGGRVFSFNQPVRVRFSVSDDAYVVVGRVSSTGRLTILFPETPSGRTFVRGNVEMIARGRATGSFASFYANDLAGDGYVFALASYAPLDLSRLRNADFGRGGTTSPFAQASYGVAFRPEAFLARFASWVLYDDSVPYDYDIDYYSVGAPRYSSALASCATNAAALFAEWDDYQVGTRWNPYASLCGNYYNTYLWCLGYSVYNYLALCSPYYRPLIVRGPSGPAGGPTGGGSDTATINRKVLLGGVWTPDTVARVGDHDPRLGLPKPTDETPRLRGSDTPGTRDSRDRIYSIPERTRDELRHRDGTVGGVGRVPEEIVVPRDRSRTGGSDRTPGSLRGPDSPGRTPVGDDTRRTTGPARDNPSRGDGAPQRYTPPARETGPTRNAAPVREGPPARESAPARETPARSYSPPVREAPPRPAPSSTPAVRESPPAASPKSDPAASKPPSSSEPPRKPPN